MSKLSYLKNCLARQLSPENFLCPNCQGDQNRIVDRKYLVTQLRRCGICQLLFRTPTDDPADNISFYEESYSQGFTTELPSDSVLEQLKGSNFAGTEKSYDYYINVLTQIGINRGAVVFDYGCSWGYGSYQLGRKGYEVTAFEVAPSRRQFAVDKLGVKVADDMNFVIRQHKGTFDCFFSAHVLEHVPSPARAFEYAHELLKPGGIFVSFTPNGSDPFRVVSRDWSKLWGEVHPNFIDIQFLERSFCNSPRVIGSSPVKNGELPRETTMKVLDSLDRYELFFAARKTGASWG